MIATNRFTRSSIRIHMLTKIRGLMEKNLSTITSITRAKTQTSSGSTMTSASQQRASSARDIGIMTGSRAASSRSPRTTKRGPCATRCRSARTRSSATRGATRCWAATRPSTRRAASPTARTWTRRRWGQRERERERDRDRDREGGREGGREREFSHY